MEHFYISSKTGISGICKYSKDFFDLVLKERGYTFIDSRENLSNIFTKVSSRSHVHIEIGIFQKKEIEILLLMLKAKYNNVSITLHDAPLLKYPLKEFKNSLLNNASKFYDRYVAHFRNALPYIQKIRAIYVLSHKGVDETRKLYKTDNIHFLPHIINPYEIEKKHVINKNFLYFGFIGKNKGIEYALKLHQAVTEAHPDVQFYVIGTALGKQMKYYDYLKKTYHKNVHFMGYVQEQELNQAYKNASFALNLFKDYGFFHPTSGSVLHNLKKGKIVLTNKVNSVPEIITDRSNGIFLSGKLRADTQQMLQLYENIPLLETIQQNVYDYITRQHTPGNVASHLTI